MPVAEKASGQLALDMVAEKLSSPEFERSVGGREADVTFLSEMMNNSVVQSLIRAQDALEFSQHDPVSCDAIELLKEVRAGVERLSSKSPIARELRKILTNSHFQALIEAHDDVASKNYDVMPEMYPESIIMPPVFHMQQQPESVRMVGIRKNPDEPLGLTLRRDLSTGGLIITRILQGHVGASPGLLHIGDIIKEINGQDVTDPDHLTELIKKSSGSITLKVIPSFYDTSNFSQVYFKSHFNYDPKRDNLIPCREAGLPFKNGDILQIVNMDDNNWWQARKVDENSPSGLVPSQSLEEKRKAFVRPEYDYTHKSLLCGIVTKKKRKMFYQTKQSAELDRHDLQIYEEVARMPPFQRRTLVLIGAQGVGRRTLKQRLIKADSSRFGAITPHTSRPLRQNEADGDGYLFISREDFENDIELNKFLEYGEYEDHYYGTKFETIRKVIKQGKICILDLNPQALKSIKTSEFMPFVVFVAAPPVEILRNMHELALQRGRTNQMKTEKDFRNTLEESKKIEKLYKQFFDLTIVNDNVDATYTSLRRAIETLSTQPQWVPVSWVY